MAKLIRAVDNRNHPIVEPGPGTLTLSYFNLLRLAAGQTVTVDVPRCEVLATVLSGRADIAACAQEFRNVGQRSDVWDGPADSVYCGTCPRVTVRALREGTEVALSGGLCDQPFAPFRIPPEEVEVMEIGSKETHSHRRLFSILGSKAAERAGRLVVSEVLVDDGCWLGYPPHKHDSEQPPEETDFEEIYHYRFKPESGFAAQLCYDGDGTPPLSVMAQHRDTFLIDRGYHPTATSPGYQGYVFRIMVGRQQRSYAPKIEPRHRHLMEKIPGAGGFAGTFR